MINRKHWANTLAIIGFFLSSVVYAGSLETNLSGWFLKSENAEIIVTGLSSAGLNFKLSAGNITPGQGCANGPGSCLTLWGWATRTEDPNEFLYANENGECVFYLRNEAQSVVIHGQKGTCGTTEINRNALRLIDGIYEPRQ